MADVVGKFYISSLPILYKTKTDLKDFRVYFGKTAIHNGKLLGYFGGWFKQGI